MKVFGPQFGLTQSNVVTGQGAVLSTIKWMGQLARRDPLAKHHCRATMTIPTSALERWCVVDATSAHGDALSGIP